MEPKKTCALCRETITHYHSDLNQLDLDGHQPVDICNDCIDQFMWWQQERFARLFPTTAAKRYLKRFR